MKEYVSFECVHMEKTNKINPDECHAFAYADIDGYSVNENEEGTVICRVWMLKEKQGCYSTFLVDWHDNRYRMNKQVLELITQAKNDLEQFRKNKVEEVFQKAYGRYKLRWLADSGQTLREILDILQNDIRNMLKLVDDMNAIEHVFHDFNECPYVNNIRCSSEDEFRRSEWEDSTYMCKILTDDEYAIWITK